MNWTNLKNEIYYVDGSLRDIYVPGTDLADWQKWIAYVNQTCRVDWFNTRTNENQPVIDFAVIEENWKGNSYIKATAKVFIDSLQINVHFFDESEMENDIDPGEFNSINDHDKLVDYMKNISILLGKEVILTPENMPEIVLIRVDKGNIELG